MSGGRCDHAQGPHHPHTCGMVCSAREPAASLRPSAQSRTKATLCLCRVTHVPHTAGWVGAAPAATPHSSAPQLRRPAVQAQLHSPPLLRGPSTASTAHAHACPDRRNACTRTPHTRTPCRAVTQPQQASIVSTHTSVSTGAPDCPAHTHTHTPCQRWYHTALHTNCCLKLSDCVHTQAPPRHAAAASAHIIYAAAT
jgi:hypothetical protein